MKLRYLLYSWTSCEEPLRCVSTCCLSQHLVAYLHMNKHTLPIWKQLYIQSCTWTNNAKRQTEWLIIGTEVEDSRDYLSSNKGKLSMWQSTGVSSILTCVLCSSSMPCEQTFWAPCIFFFSSKRRITPAFASGDAHSHGHLVSALQLGALLVTWLFDQSVRGIQWEVCDCYEFLLLWR